MPDANGLLQRLSAMPHSAIAQDGSAVERRAEGLDRPPELERVEQGDGAIELRLRSGAAGGRERRPCRAFRPPRRMLMLLGVQHRPERESDHEQRN